MKTSVVLTSAALSAATLLGYLVAFQSRAHEPQPLASTTHDVELKRLNAAVRQLSARVSTLEQQARVAHDRYDGTLRANSPPQPVEPPIEATASMDEQEQAILALRRSPFRTSPDDVRSPQERVEEVLAQEARDRGFANEMLGAAREVWTGRAPNVRFEKLTCGNTLCRVDLTFAEEDASAVRGVVGVAPFDRFLLEFALPSPMDGQLASSFYFGKTMPN